MGDFQYYSRKATMEKIKSEVNNEADGKKAKQELTTQEYNSRKATMEKIKSKVNNEANGKNEPSLIGLNNSSPEPEFDYDAEKMKVEHWTSRLEKARKIMYDIGNATGDEKTKLELIYKNMSPNANEDTIQAIDALLKEAQDNVSSYEQKKAVTDRLDQENAFFKNIYDIKDPNSEHYDEKYDYYVQTALDWDQNKVKGVKDGKSAKELGISEDDYLRYLELTDDEYEAYNYFLGRYGGETAKQFVNQIERSLNSLSYRAAKKISEDEYTGTGSGIKTVAGAGLGGLERWGQDTGRAIYNAIFDVFNDPNEYHGEEYYRQDISQLANQISRNEHGGVVKIASDVADAGGYMLPSILEAAAVTYVTKGMGASAQVANVAGRITSSMSMGTAVASQSYAEMINLGYSKEQAQTYGLMSGLSEVCLEMVLGGIKIPGGAVTGEAAEGIAKSLNKVIGKISVEYGDDIAHLLAEMGSEALEESLQEVLSPVLKSAVTGDEFEPAKLEDVLYAGLLGALSSGIINSSQNVVSYGVEAVENYRTGKTILNSENGSETVEQLQRNANLYPANSVVSKLSQKVDKKANAYNIGKLFNAEGAYLTNQNVADIQKSLERKGVKSSSAQAISQTFAKIVAGEEVSQAEIKAIEINEPLVKTINDVILNPKSTVNQRMTNFSDVAQEIYNLRQARKYNPTNSTPKTNVAENGKILSGTNGTVVTPTQSGVQAQLTNVQSLSPIAKTMGESGGKALLSLYDGGVNTDVYAEEFLSVYNAVIKGRKIPSISSLSPAQVQAAVFAAENDLKAKNNIAKAQKSGYNENVTFEEESALVSYKTGDSYTLNGMIRELNGTEGLDEYHKEMSNKLDTALEKLPIYKGRVYRNIGFDDLSDAEEQYNAFMSEIEPNAPFIDAAFMSTSTKRDGYPVEGKYIVHMEIESLNGRTLEGFGNNFESEVLFPRNSAFIVNDIVYDSDGVPTIYMEEIENAGKILNTEKSYGTVRNVQKHNSEDSNVQGVSERDTDGNATRNVGPQGSVPWGQRDSIRAQRPEQDNSSTTRQKQSEINGGINNVEQRTESGSESQQRTRSVSSSEQSSGVLRGTEETQRGAETRESQRESTSSKRDTVRTQKVSTASLGISKGTNEKTLSVIPRSEYTAEMEALFKEQFRKGVTVIFFNGELQMKGENGKVFTARGAVSAKGTRMFVRADHETLSVRQIIKHEEFHVAVMKNPAVYETTRKKVVETYGEAELDELVNSYIDEYGWDGMDMDYQEIVEEILADAYAGIDVFDYLSTYEGATRFSETVVDAAEQFNAENETNKGPPQTKNTATESDDVKFSVEKTIKMAWTRQIDEFFSSKGQIKRNDTLVIETSTPAYLHLFDTENLPLAVPLSIVTKAIKGKDKFHSIKKENLRNLQDGIRNAKIIVKNPQRKALVFITNIKQGEYPIAITFEENTMFDGDRVHKATSIHLRENVESMLYGLPETSTIFFENKNEFKKTVGVTNNLRSLAANVEFISDILTQYPENVNTKTSQDKVVNDIREANALLKEQFNEIKALKKELKAAESAVKGYNRQVKLSEKFEKTREHQNVKMANDLIKRYDTDLDEVNVDEIIDGIREIKDYVYDTDENFGSYTMIKDKAVGVATKLIKNSVALVDDGLRDTYKQYKSYLKNTRLTISEQDRPDLGVPWNEFRKKNLGKLRLANNGLPVDTAYMELQETYGKGFFPDDITHPADQLQRMLEVLGKLEPVYENPYDHNMAQAIERCANDIVYGIFRDEVNANSQIAINEYIKSDKLRNSANQRLEQIRKEGIERTREAVEKVRRERDEKVESIKKEWADKKSSFFEGRREVELRERIYEHTKSLSKKLLKPNDKQHIPEKFKTPVAKLLQFINLESVYTIDENGRYKKDPYGAPTKRTEAFRAIREAYKELVNELVVSPELFDGDNGGLLERVEKLEDKPINSMNVEELTVIWNTISAIENSISSYNEMFSATKYKTISETSQALRNDNKGKKSVGELGWAKNLTAIDMLTPETFFHQLGETGEGLFRALRDGQDKYVKIMAHVEEFVSELGVKAKALESEMHEVVLAGQKVNVSTANLMELYALYNRPQAKVHIENGGVLFERAKGLKKKNYTPRVYEKLTVFELEQAFMKIGVENIKLADKMQEFLSTVMADYGNEASMQVFNYKKYLEQKYWPIKVNGEEIKTTLEGVTAVKSIANKSHAKQTVEKAKNSIAVGSIFDTFTRHCVDMASYAAYLAPIQDVNRIINFQFKDDLGEVADTVKGIIKNVYGVRNQQSVGESYLQNLIADISSANKVDKEYTSWFFANFKAAAVGTNLRVVVQQPTAILRAMDMISPKYIASSFKTKGWEKAKKYAPIAKWKDWGYFDINTGLSAKEILFGNNNIISTVREKSMWLAGKMDSLSWGALWNACEAEIKDKHKELEVGSEEFYKTVAQRFTEIIDHTQVVDGVLQRSQIMREKSFAKKMATAFMGEPTKIYNMMTSAIYDMRYANDAASKNKAKTRLVRTVFALLVSGVLNAVMQSFDDALRDDDRDETYWQKFGQAFLGFEGDEEKWYEYILPVLDGNLAGTLLPHNYFPYLKDFSSIFLGYDLKRTDMQGFSELWKSVEAMWKAFILGKEVKYNTFGLWANFIAKAANFLGVSVGNLKRDLESIMTSLSFWSKNYLFQYYWKKFTLNVNYDYNGPIFKDILWDAYCNDTKAYREIYADLEKSGYDMSKIKREFEERMKDEQGVKSVDDLKNRYLSPSQEKEYNSSLNKVKKSNVWKSASETRKKALETDIYNLTVQNSAGEKLQEKIDGGKKHGVDETEFLLYQLALDMVDKPTESGKLGTRTNSEREAALRMLGLSESESSYLWLMSGGSEKSNPYD
jgi:hypothetical protein